MTNTALSETISESSSAQRDVDVKLNGIEHKQHDEDQYISLIRRVLVEGERRADRTGTGTLSLFAPPQLRFSLADMTLPLLTTKRTFLRGIVEELIWFIRGSTDSTLLSRRGVKIWDGNGSKEFLEKRGLSHRREGDLGPVYGFQWRHFGAKYEDCDANYAEKGVDQLKECIRRIQQDPTDRRIILSAWNPADIPLMALPPCHMMCQFYVHLPQHGEPAGTKPRLSCLMYQRSADLGLGIPFNIASYALLTHIIAHLTSTTAHEVIIQLGDAHVYLDHVDALKVQLERSPRAFPKLRFKRTREEIEAIAVQMNPSHDDPDFPVGKVEAIDVIGVDDIIVEGYNPWPAITMKMSV